MKLYIDTSNSDKVIVGLDGEMHESESKKEKSQRLLPFIVELLEEKNLTPQDISEIEVMTGPGSFTGLRVGVTIAQTLGWALEVPVNGKNLRKGEEIEIKY